MSVHPHEHEELLAALASGERRPDEAEAARALRECATCAEEWERVRALSVRLERAGVARRAELSELARERPAEGEEHVLATLLGMADEERRPRRRALLAWAAAAAVLLAGAWLASRWLSGSDEPRDPTWLGGEGVELVFPLGAVDAPRFEQFRWSYTGNEAETFTLRVYESDGGQPGVLVLDRSRLKETTWTLDEDARAKLPARIVWEVEAYDEFRVSLGSQRSQAWLSGR